MTYDTGRQFNVLFALCFGLFLSQAVLAKPVKVDCTPLEEPLKGTVIGELEYTAGCELTNASSSWFGGLSSLFSAKSPQLLAVSDRGFLVSIVPQANDAGELQDIAFVDMAILPDRESGTVRSMREGVTFADAEGVVQQCDGTLLVSFERQHRVWRYGVGRPIEMTVPESLQLLPYNSGVESIGYFPEDEALLLIAEEGGGDAKTIPAWLGRDLDWKTLDYVPEDGLMPTDIAIAPGGDVYILERDYGIYPRFDIRIRHTTRAEIEKTGRIEGKELFRSHAGWIDNMEGIAVAEHDATRYLYLVSDNNYSRERRSLLLQFKLPGTFPEVDTGCGKAKPLLDSVGTQPEEQ